MVESRAQPEELDRERLLRITARRARILRELTDGYSGRAAALRLGISLSGLRSHVQALRGITGCASVRELARWWGDHREVWLLVMGQQAGLPAVTEENTVVAPGETDHAAADPGDTGR